MTYVHHEFRDCKVAQKLRWFARFGTHSHSNCFDTLSSKVLFKINWQYQQWDTTVQQEGRRRGSSVHNGVLVQCKIRDN